MAQISYQYLNFVLELHVFYYLQMDYWEQVKFNHGVGFQLKICRFFTTDAVILALILLSIQMAKKSGNVLTLLYIISPPFLLLIITIFTLLFLLFSFVDFLFLAHYGKHSDK